MVRILRYSRRNWDDLLSATMCKMTALKIVFNRIIWKDVEIHS